ncbi:hypothetical protein YC2023_084357 [Brassica napus]
MCYSGHGHVLSTLHSHDRVVYHSGCGYFFFLLRPYWYQVMGLIQEVSIHCFSSVIHYFCPASNRLIHGLIVLDSGIPPIK